MIEKGIADADVRTRSQAYSMVFRVRETIDVRKLVDAALKETESMGVGDSLQALSVLKDPGHVEGFKGLDQDTKGKLSDLAMKSLDEPGRVYYARDLLTTLSKAGMFSQIVPRVRDELDKAAKAERRDLRRVSVLVDVLTGVEDGSDVTNKLVRALAAIANPGEAPSVEVRQACVRWFAAVGIKSDIPFLRELRNRSDAAAPNVTGAIDDAINKIEAR
jgi:hypothetical protein